MNWYFTKNSLPYWIILLIDCAILMSSGVLTYWMFNNVVTLYENALQVLNTTLVFIVLSIPGFRIFHTYSGFMRYSSFIDLMRVAYCNGITLLLALISEYFMHYLPGNYFAHYNTTSIFLIFIIATLLMWALRIFVKTLYDVAFSNTRAKRILI
ncbi:MAG: polysaccharide biosynthesis protein, partial [Prevotella sp.]|nr:polysaccharide biosynthesis protein [Prevotella sp.]